MALFGEYGPFFTVEQHDTAKDRDGQSDPSWQPLFALPESPAVAERIDEVQLALTTSRRVAGSVAQLGLVARLVAPALAASVRAGHQIGLVGWYWRPPLASTFMLSLPSDPAPGSMLDGPIQALTEGLPLVPRRVAWGNVASGLNTAAMLLGPAAYRYADDVLAEIATEPGPAGPGFQRHSCCLLYRAGRPFCGDCVLA